MTRLPYRHSKLAERPLESVLIRIDSREDYVPEHMVERLYETALSRGDEARASHLLERLTSPDPRHRRRR